jgi:hypothetical protein
MISSPNEFEPCAPLFAISVNATDEFGGEPSEHQTKQHLNRNAIGYAVKLQKQESVDRFTHPKRCKQHSCSEQIYFQTLHWLKAYRVVAAVTCPHRVHPHTSLKLSLFPELAVCGSSLWQTH